MCLIPKIDSLVSPKDYKPISLSNVSYKIISKILVERLKPWLHKIIFENQSTFISGRMITYNIIIAHELLHSLHTKKLVHIFVAWKLDISKAFDKLEWSFVDIVMRKMGFNDVWRKMDHDLYIYYLLHIN